MLFFLQKVLFFSSKSAFFAFFFLKLPYEDWKFKLLGSSGQKVHKLGTLMCKLFHISESTNIWWRRLLMKCSILFGSLSGSIRFFISKMFTWFWVGSKVGQIKQTLCDLFGFEFVRCDLVACQLVARDLFGCDFVYCDSRSWVFVNWMGDLFVCELVGCDLFGCELVVGDLFGCHLVRCDLAWCQLVGCEWNVCDLFGYEFVGCEWDGCFEVYELLRVWYSCGVQSNRNEIDQNTYTSDRNLSGKNALSCVLWFQEIWKIARDNEQESWKNICSQLVIQSEGPPTVNLQFCLSICIVPRWTTPICKVILLDLELKLITGGEHKFFLGQGS